MAYYDYYDNVLEASVLTEEILTNIQNNTNKKQKSSETMVVYTINDAKREYKPGDYILIQKPTYKPAYAKLIAINTGPQTVIFDKIKSDVIFCVQWIKKTGRFDDSYENIEYANATFNKATKEEIYLKSEESLHTMIEESKKKIEEEQSKIRSYKNNLQALRRLYK